MLMRSTEEKWLRELYGMSAFSRNRGFSFCSNMGQVFKKRFALTIDRCRILIITAPISKKKNMKNKKENMKK